MAVGAGRPSEPPVRVNTPDGPSVHRWTDMYDYVQDQGHAWISFFFHRRRMCNSPGAPVDPAHHPGPGLGETRRGETRHRRLPAAPAAAAVPGSTQSLPLGPPPRRPHRRPGRRTGPLPAGRTALLAGRRRLGQPGHRAVRPRPGPYPGGRRRSLVGLAGPRDAQPRARGRPRHRRTRLGPGPRLHRTAVGRRLGRRGGTRTGGRRGSAPGARSPLPAGLRLELVGPGHGTRLARVTRADSAPAAWRAAEPEHAPAVRGVGRGQRRPRAPRRHRDPGTEQTADGRRGADTAAAGDGNGTVRCRKSDRRSRTSARARGSSPVAAGARTRTCVNAASSYTKKVKAAFVHHTASGNKYWCSQAPVPHPRHLPLPRGEQRLAGHRLQLPRRPVRKHLRGARRRPGEARDGRPHARIQHGQHGHRRPRNFRQLQAVQSGSGRDRPADRLEAGPVRGQSEREDIPEVGWWQSLPKGKERTTERRSPATGTASPPSARAGCSTGSSARRARRRPNTRGDEDFGRPDGRSGRPRQEAEDDR